MWTTILNLGVYVLGLFGIGKSKSDVQSAQEAGEAQGIAEQKSADESAVIKDVSDAKTASNSVDTGFTPGVPVTKSDGFRRD